MAESRREAALRTEIQNLDTQSRELRMRYRYQNIRNHYINKNIPMEESYYRKQMSFFNIVNEGKKYSDAIHSYYIGEGDVRPVRAGAATSRRGRPPRQNVQQPRARYGNKQPRVSVAAASSRDDESDGIRPIVGGKAARKRPRQAASSDEESGNESDVPIVRLQTKRSKLKKKLLELQNLSIRSGHEMYDGLEEAMKFV